MPHRITAPVRSRALAADGGFTLMEVVVAMTIFTVMAGTVLGLLVKTAGTTGSNIRRTTAANLAGRQIESLRKLGVAEIKNLPTTTTNSGIVVGGITYTVKQDVTPADKASTASICTPPGSGTPSTKVSFSRVSVTVTWANMGSTPPVKAQTLLSLGTGSDYAASGAPAAITVSGPDGTLPGLPVDLVNATPSDVQQETTDGNGCATFVGLLLSSNYLTSVDVPGYVGQTNQQKYPTAGQTVDTSTGNLVRSTIDGYARVRSLNVTTTVPAGATAVSGIKLRLARNAPALAEYTPATCPGVVTSSCSTGVLGAGPVAVSAIYPAIYQVKAGGCTDTESVASADVSGSPSAPLTVNIPLGAVTVTVKDLFGTLVTGSRLVKFTHPAPATGCSVLDSYDVTVVGGQAVVGLPLGKWTVTTQNVAVPSPSPTVTTLPLPTPSPAVPAQLTVDVTTKALTPTAPADLRVVS